METINERILGAELAKKMGALKTLVVIQDEKKCYEDIFKSAIEEVGLDKFAKCILEQDPSWSHYALRFVPNLGEHRDALVERATLLYKNMVKSVSPQPNADLSTANNTESVGGLRLTLINPIFYECWFTMSWVNAGVTQPSTGTPDNGQWKWSKKLSIGINKTDIVWCSDCALPNSPISTGDTVQMLVKINGGGLYETGFFFTYDSSVGGTTGDINANGAPTNPSFSKP